MTLPLRASPAPLASAARWLVVAGPSFAARSGAGRRRAGTTCRGAGCRGDSAAAGRFTRGPQRLFVRRARRRRPEAAQPAAGRSRSFRRAKYPVALPAVSLLGARNDLPNPYQPGVDWGQLPAGRKWGSTASVTTAPDGTIWVVDRCGNSGAGGTTCGGASASVNPIFQFDTSGKLLKTFGAGHVRQPAQADGRQGRQPLARRQRQPSGLQARVRTARC